MNERNSIKTWMIIAIIVLFIINLVAITTIFIQNKQNSRNYMGPNYVFKDQPYRHFHKFLQDEMKLSDKEMTEFHDLRQKYMEESKSTMFKMGEKRSLLFDEVIKETIDTNRLNNLNVEMDSLHASLHQLTLKHFLEVKKILSTDQQKKYFRFLNEMSNKFGPPPGMRKGKNCPGPGFDAE